MTKEEEAANPLEGILREEARRPFYRTWLGRVTALILGGVGVYFVAFLRARGEEDAKGLFVPEQEKPAEAVSDHAPPPEPTPTFNERMARYVVFTLRSVKSDREGKYDQRSTLSSARCSEGGISGFTLMRASKPGSPYVEAPAPIDLNHPDSFTPIQLGDVYAPDETYKLKFCGQLRDNSSDSGCSGELNLDPDDIIRLCQTDQKLSLMCGSDALGQVYFDVGVTSMELGSLSQSLRAQVRDTYTRAEVSVKLVSITMIDTPTSFWDSAEKNSGTDIRLSLRVVLGQASGDINLGWSHFVPPMRRGQKIDRLETTIVHSDILGDARMQITLQGIVAECKPHHNMDTPSDWRCSVVSCNTSSGEWVFMNEERSLDEGTFTQALGRKVVCLKGTAGEFEAVLEASVRLSR